MAGMLRKREGQGQGQGQGQSREMAQAGAREPLQRQTMWDPFRSFGMTDPFRRMREMLSWDPFSELESMMAPTGRMFAPDIEVRETKDAYLITADLPGLKEDDVSIDVSGNRLTISGKREAEQREEGERYWAYERSYGNFTRSFTLPEGVQPEQIDAQLQSGVLQVRIPKTKAEEPKRIQIKGGSQTEQQGAASGTRPTTQTTGTQTTGTQTTGTQTTGTQTTGTQTSAGTQGTTTSQTTAGAGTTSPTQGGSREKAA